MRCPLCAETRDLVVRQKTAYATLWSELAREMKVNFSDEVRRANSPAAETALVHCRTCDLFFFWPIAPGNNAFYAELVRGPYYNEHPKWEFGWALDTLSPSDKGNKRVLDVGCGPGDFLALAHQRGHDVVGLELDAATAAGTRRRGIEVHEKLVEDFSLEASHSFDVACSFHVLEHVADPVSFVTSLVTLVRKGGLVVLSVPNANRTWRPKTEPLEYPPHHVTRWTARSLAYLAARAGARLETTAIEPLGWETARHSLEKKIHARVGGMLGAVSGFLASRTLLPSERLYEALHISRRLEWSGLSVVVALRV